MGIFGETLFLCLHALQCADMVVFIVILSFLQRFYTWQ